MAFVTNGVSVAPNDAAIEPNDGADEANGMAFVTNGRPLVRKVLAHFDPALFSESGNIAMRSAISSFRDSTPAAMAGVTPLPKVI